MFDTWLVQGWQIDIRKKGLQKGDCTYSLGISSLFFSFSFPSSYNSKRNQPE
jgi:hypothetical protein